jgi:cell division protein FtsI (penicillin-binding protein 3)
VSENKNAILWRIYVVMLFMLLLAMLVLLRIAYLQYFQGAELIAKSNEKTIKPRKVEAQRGNILSADGSLLATSLPYYKVHWDLQAISSDTFYKYLDTLSICIATFIDVESTVGSYRNRLMSAYQANNRYFRVGSNLSYLQVERIRSFPLLNRNEKEIGLIIEPRNKRHYPFKALASQTVGQVRYRDAEGKTVYFNDIPNRDIELLIKDTVITGLESSFNSVLAGESIDWMMQKIDNNNTWIPLGDISKIEARAGQDIITTIDVNMQVAAHEALTRALEKYQADDGCVVLMEVATGDIKAIVNLGYTPDRKTIWEFSNHAITHAVEPGSSFKIASMMALYEDGKIRLDDTIELNQGKMDFYDQTMEDASSHGLYRASVEKAFEISSNVGIAKLVDKHFNKSKEGQERFVEYLRNFRLDKITGIDFPNEDEPLIKSPKATDWSQISALWMSIGYELELTPLQLATFYNAIANNGKMMKPRLVKEVRAYGETSQIFKPEALSRSIAKDETIKFAKYLLLRPVEGNNGTARTIRTSQYRIAGKTGTAIYNYKDHVKKGVPKRYRASFSGFFPADNPAYTCVVFITNPRTGTYGGVVAAPVFREIADKCYPKAVKSQPAINAKPVTYTNKTLPYLQVGFKDEIKVIFEYLNIPFYEDANTAWTVAQIQNDSLHLSMLNMQEDIVPNVLGMGLRDALYLLENRGITVSVNGVGKVKSQSIKAGRSTKGLGVLMLTLGS